MEWKAAQAVAERSRISNHDTLTQELNANCLLYYLSAVELGGVWLFHAGYDILLTDTQSSVRTSESE